MAGPWRRLDAYPMYLFSQGVFALAFSMIVTVDLVYQVQIAHLNPLQLVLVGTVVEGTTFLLEVPTGIVADVYSRRLSIVIGTVMMGLGLAIEGSFPRFDVILLAQVIWGAGFTFTSGATEAWISDEIGEANAGSAFLRAAQFGQACELLGIGVSIALANVFLQLPIILGGMLVSVLGVIELLLMPETAFWPIPRESHNSWQQMALTFKTGLQMIKQRTGLVTIFGTIAVYGAFSEGFDRLWTPHLLDHFTLPVLWQLPPVAWFGVIHVTEILLAVAVTEFVRRRVDTNSHSDLACVLLIANALTIAGVIVFGLATDFVLAVVILSALLPLRRMNSPIQMAWVNQRLDSNVRATVISMSSQMNALGQISGGPILGAVATLATTRVEMVAAAVALSPALILYARTIRDQPAKPAQKEGEHDRHRTAE